MTDTVSVAEYLKAGPLTVFTHTEVAPAYAGRPRGEQGHGLR